MSGQSRPQTDEKETPENRLELFPLESAADVGRTGYARVQFDQHISQILREHARQRAPTEADVDYRNHLIGIAGEIAVATWRGGRINHRIYPDFEGDTGIDVTAPSRWKNGQDTFQVKATKDITNPEQGVEEDEIEKADYFVLCCTNAPARYVEIVGYVHQPLLKRIGKVYARGEYLLSPEHLYPVEPALYEPDEVREVVRSNIGYERDSSC